MSNGTAPVPVPDDRSSGAIDDPHSSATVGSPTPQRLRVDARSQVDGGGRFLALATSTHPRLSWSVPLVRADQRQVAFEAKLRVQPAHAQPSETPQPSETRRTDAALWTSGVVESSDPWVVVALSLPDHTATHARVRTKDERGVWSAWTGAVAVETGPQGLTAWHADWVSHPALHVLRRVFTLDGSADRARLHLTAQGLVRASINGTTVNASSSDPSRTDISRALYRSYDVTDLVHDGQNVLDLAIAHGEWERTGLDPRVLATVVVDLADGSRVFAGTGADMLVAASEVVTEEPFYLERHDLRLPQGEFAPSDRLRTLVAVAAPTATSTPPQRVEVDPGPPVHGVQSNHAAERRSVGSGARTWDVGVNIAGRSRVTVHSALPADTVLRVIHGEHIGDAGHVDTTNLSMPYDHGRTRQAVEYLLPATDAGSARALEPWFSFHGFRYVEVVGLPSDAVVTVQAIALHSDLRSISTVSTDDDAVNALIVAARRTLLNNVHGIPEDCPTREQSGWTGDTASVTEFEFSAFDMQAFFTKWIGDLLTSQQPGGWIPAIAPDIRPEKVPADPVWGAALQRVLWGHWLHYGDIDVVRRCLPALRAWADFQLDCRTPDGVIGASPISYGHDWLALQQTPPELHHTAATIDSLTVLADLEQALGDTDAAARRRAEAARLSDAARLAFVDRSTATVGNGSQASYALALEGDWLSERERTIARKRLTHDVRTRGNRVSSGFATTRTVVRALAHNGASQLVLDALHQREEPGVGAMLTLGNGTFWECWWIDPQNTGTGSLDHVGLGGPFASWVWQSLAGVQPIEAGYARFLVEPQFVEGVDTLELTTETVRGIVGVCYTREGDEVVLKVTVPVGADAVIRLPSTGESIVGPGTHTIRGLWQIGGGAHVSSVASGNERANMTEVNPARPWSAPSWAPVSADVNGRTDLLEYAGANDGVTAGNETSAVEIVSDNLRCMPVPHAQLRGPLVLVRGTDAAAAAPTPTVTTTFSQPLRLDDASFVYAMIDLCSGSTRHPTHTVLTLTADDGTELSANGHIWPAGWNRASVDVGEWAGRTRVRAISVGVAFGDGPADGVQPVTAAASVPASFHLGEIGYSTTQRTWP